MRKKGFWREWGQTAVAAVDTGLGRAAVGLTLLTSLGLKIADWQHAYWGFAVLGAIIAGIILWTKPKTIEAPNLTSKIDINLLNHVLLDSPRISLLGLEGSGKTSFLDASVSRVPVARRTEKSYGQFVTLPDTAPEQNLLIVDSVGGNHSVQFSVQQLASRSIFFIDHNGSGEKVEIDDNRLLRHEELARQLANSAVESAHTIDRIIIVVGKSDLWQSDENSTEKMKELAEKIQGIFAAAVPYRVVKVYLPFSNNSRYDTASLLKEFAE